MLFELVPVSEVLKTEGTSGWREGGRRCELQKEVRKRKEVRQRENRSGFIPLAGATADIPEFDSLKTF